MYLVYLLTNRTGTPTLQARFRTGVQTQGLPGTGNFSFHGSGPNVQAGNNRGFNLPVPPFKFPEFQARPAQNFRPPGARLGALPMDMREATAATRVPDGRGGYHPTARWLGANVPKAPPRRYDPMEAALADFDNGRQAGSGARAPRAQTPSLEARGRGHIPTSSAALNPFHQQDQAGFASMTRLANANAGRGSSRAYVPDFNSAENQGFQRRVVSGPGNSSAGNLGNFDPLSRTDRYGSTAGNMRGPQITENVAVPGAGFGSFYPITTSSAFNAPSRALSSAGEFGPFNGSRTHGNLGFGSSGVEGMGAGNSGVGGMRNMPSSSGQTTRKSRYLGGPSQSSRPEGYPSHFPAPGSLGNMAPEYLPAGYIRDPHGIYGEQCSRPLQWLIDRDPSYLEAWEIVNSGRPLTGRIVQENVHPGVLLGLNMPGTYPGGGIGNQNLNAPRPGNVEGSQRQSTPHAGGPFDIGAPGNVAGSDQTTFQEIKMTRRELEECVANTALGAELDDFFETERLAKLQYYTDELQECVDAAKKDDPEKSGGDGNDDGRAEALQTCIDLIQDVPTKKSGGDGTAGGN